MYRVIKKRLITGQSTDPVPGDIRLWDERDEGGYGGDLLLVQLHRQTSLFLLRLLLFGKLDEEVPGDASLDGRRSHGLRFADGGVQSLRRGRELYEA